MRPMREAEVSIRFSPRSRRQVKHLYGAAGELSKAGVFFDTGVGAKGNDWEFDWSLRGAKVFLRRYRDNLRAKREKR